MELLILLKLKWDLYGPVAKDFIKELVQLLPADISKSDDVDLVARHASTYADVVAIGKKKNGFYFWCQGILRAIGLIQFRASWVAREIIADLHDFKLGLVDDRIFRKALILTLKTESKG